MYPQAIEALLAMDEYVGTLDSFLDASATAIQTALDCSAEQADRVLQSLRQENMVVLDVAPATEIPITVSAVPLSCWYWYLPDAA